MCGTGVSMTGRWDGHINADKEGSVLRLASDGHDCPAHLVYYPLYGWC
jgi:hypothetical protein